MFDHVVLRRAENGDPISIGEVIEALLYYQSVHLFIDRSTLFQCIHQVGPDQLLTLLSRSELSAVYCEEMLGVFTDSVGPMQVHKLGAFTLVGHETIGKLKTPEERLRFELEREGLNKDVARRFTKSFLRQVPIRKFSGKHFTPEGIHEAAKKDVIDSDGVKKSVRQVVATEPGGYDLGENFRFDVVNSDLGLYVSHDIELSAINARRTKLSPQVEPLTIAHILSKIQEARADLVLSSFYGGDFFTSRTVSSVIQSKCNDLLRRTLLNVEARTQFTEVVLPDAPSVAEVINSGERSIKEALLLLDRASRFKDWLKKINPDEGIVRTYIQDISAEGWIQRLPAKSLRYVFTLALEAKAPAASLAAGFVDNFLVEKFLSGWRPNHFVKSKLGPFVNAS